MKKTMTIIMIILLLLSSFTLTANAISFTVTLSPAQANVPSGNTVDIYVSASNLNIGGSGMNVFSCILNYDKTIFEEISDSNITGLNGWEVSYNTSTGKILLDNENYITEDSQLCKITFTVKSTVTEGSGEISVTNPETSNGTIDITGTSESAIIYVKQISSDEYEITEDNKITGVTPGTTVDEFKDNVTGSENATIKDKNGNVITSGNKIGTGATIEIPGEETFTVIVKADINGDGEITVTDLSKVKLHIVEITLIEEPYKTAADINGDGKITITDVSKLKQVIVGNETL